MVDRLSVQSTLLIVAVAAPSPGSVAVMCGTAGGSCSSSSLPVDAVVSVAVGMRKPSYGHCLASSSLPSVSCSCPELCHIACVSLTAQNSPAVMLSDQTQEHALAVKQLVLDCPYGFCVTLNL